MHSFIRDFYAKAWDEGKRIENANERVHEMMYPMHNLIMEGKKICCKMLKNLFLTS